MLNEFMQSPAYVMACQQYDRVADFLDVPQGERARTKMPKRAFIVMLPTRMDDGRIEMFVGYRVHSLPIFLGLYFAILWGAWAAAIRLTEPKVSPVAQPAE